MYSANNSANGEPFWLHQGFPKHHYNELLQGKYQKPPWAQTNTSIFKIHPQKSYICPENQELKLAQHWPRITPEHLQENALRIITYNQQ